MNEISRETERAAFLTWHNDRRSSIKNAWTAWQARAGLQNPQPDSEDAARYRFLCANPDWHFIEKLCRQFVAKSEAEFKQGLDAAIDAATKAMK